MTFHGWTRPGIVDRAEIEVRFIAQNRGGAALTLIAISLVGAVLEGRLASIAGISKTLEKARPVLLYLTR